VQDRARVIRKAVIPAAGLGTRFLPAAKAVPKEMALILDRPAIQWIVEEALAAGVEEVIIVSCAGKPAIAEHFTPRPELLASLRQRGRREAVAALEHLDQISRHVRFVWQDEQRGLGHAVLCAADAIGDEPFLVLLGDALVRSEVPCARRLTEIAAETGGYSVVGLERVPSDRVGRYGIVGGKQLRDRLFQLSELVEKPAPGQAPSDLAIAGRYLLTPRVLEFLRRARPGHGGEIQLTDAIRALVTEEPVFGYVYEGKRYDIGDPLACFEAVLAFARADPAYRARLEAFGPAV